MKFYSIVVLIVLSFLTACSSISTQNEYTQQFDFIGAMTYNLDKESGTKFYDEIKEAINITMAHKGLGINTSQYDFLIDWNLESDGSLNIEIYDPQTMDIVWRGWTNETVTQKSIPTAVKKMFNDFPPKTIAVFN